MSERYNRGTRFDDAGGRHAMSCSNGVSGLPISNLISSNILGMLIKSLNIGPAPTIQV